MQKYYFSHPTPDELIFISDQTWQEPHLAFRPLHILKNVQVCRLTSGQLIGWIERFPLTKNFYSLSTLYVLPQFRNMGFAKLIIKEAIKNLKSANIIACTANSSLINTLKSSGFHETRLSCLPLTIFLNLLFKRYIFPKAFFKLLKSAGHNLKYFIRYA